MSGWGIFGLVLLVLLLIGCIPVGVDARYEEGALALWVKAGFLRLQLLPAKPKKKSAKQKKEKPAKGKASEPAGETPAQKKPALPKLTLADIRALLELLCDALGELRRKLRVEELLLHVTIPGADAARAAIRYGQCWAAIGALTPMLDRLFVIKKRDIQPILDYNETKSELRARLALTITIGRALALGGRVGVRLLRLWLEKKKAVQKHESSSF